MISSTNLYYVRYSDTPGIPSANQPQFEIVEALGEDTGWTGVTYKIFSKDYIRYSMTPGITTDAPEEYQRHGFNNEPLPVGDYVRHDEDNNAIAPQDPLVPGGPAIVVAPEDLVSGRMIYAGIPNYSGGTPAVEIEVKWLYEENPGSWTEITDWEDVSNSSFEIPSDEIQLGNDMLNSRMRADYRISDRNTAPIVTEGVPSSPVVRKLRVLPGTRGVVTGQRPDDTATPGTLLVQTRTQFDGGSPPYDETFNWQRRLVGSNQWRSITGTVKDLEYTVTEEDIGYEIRGRSRARDIHGYVKASGTITIVTITED